MSPLAFHPGLDVEAAARMFAATGHVRLRPVLTEAAAQSLHLEARGRHDWKQVLNSGSKVFELDRPTRASMTPEQVAALDTAVIAGARAGFQYRYETLRLPDGNAPSPATDSLLARLPHWLSAPEQRAILQTITGHPDIAFADGQATAYSPGDFLTGHDDAVAGKNRRAAYVLGLTPVWRVEWGGLLLFHDGAALRGVSPEYNSLDLFAVPQLHSVSQVTAAAAYRRYAITGWLRAGGG
ncbi:Rps23 Pro-64 3,4-dihydroxylase Tpa1-like proline 4-hydroxylase [Polymorphobacter multimanifer]|uniref:Rps23 Pro-64 3,4-dihydroxylase Tpa1-like proline 4-hydroxylase n=1 Tax=Polymorphobacter multimanifer TaxID=1070431 RepID=A0A841L883_9SPHN|nr:Rps23 Pro-64 3,4-dihydroxylase Tpa1-like proline 4-hydroxylase [Polymorphobacter multimanifer]